MTNEQPNVLNEQEFLAELRGHIAKHYRTQIAAAAHWGIPPQYLNQMVGGKRAPSKEILKEMGYSRKKEVTKTIEYRKK